MTRTLIGLDSQGVACVKITKGNINPVTEPDANVSSFLYNSKWSADVKLAATDSTPFQTGNRYVPSGANINNYQKVMQAPFVGSAAVKDIGDRAPLTSGNNNVLRQFSSGGDNVVQFLRPGAGNPPAVRDVVLDSRWPSLQILAQGYRSIAAATSEREPPSVNTGQSFTINFDADGFFPIVKYTTVHQHRTYGKCVRFAQTLITENHNGSLQYHQGNSSYCQLSGNAATFWTFNGNPYQERYVNSWVYDYVPDPIIGIRYYILGIPAL